MKMLQCLSILLLALAVAIAHGKFLWEVDFEDGLASSSAYMAGTASVVGGNMSAPYHVANAVLLVQDPCAACDYGVNAGAGGAWYCYDLGTFALGPTAGWHWISRRLRCGLPTGSVERFKRNVTTECFVEAVR